MQPPIPEEHIAPEEQNWQPQPYLNVYRAWPTQNLEILHRTQARHQSLEDFMKKKM